MHDKILFSRLIESNELIKSVIINNGFLKIDFSQLDYTKEWDNQYIFKNIHLNEYTFKAIEVQVTPENIWLSLLSDNTVFFENPMLFFDNEGIKHEKEPYIIDGKEIKEFRRKLGSIILFNRSARVSVLKSDLYGCIIKLTIGI
jgi:hypothetical protein